MIAIRDLTARLSAIGCRAELCEGRVSIVGAVERLPADLKAEIRRSKLAIRHALLQEQAEGLVGFIDGDAPLGERLEKLPELLAVQERLSRAQAELWASWLREGFTIIWSPITEEFILVGDSPPPPGSEALVLYTSAEVEAMKDASPEAVVRAHRVKKAFRGTVWREK